MLQPKEMPDTTGMSDLQKIFSARLPRGHKIWSFDKNTSILMWHDIHSFKRNDKGNIVIVEEKGVMWATAHSRNEAIKIFQRKGFNIFHNGNSPKFLATLENVPK